MSPAVNRLSVGVKVKAAPSRRSYSSATSRSAADQPAARPLYDRHQARGCARPIIRYRLEVQQRQDVHLMARASTTSGAPGCRACAPRGVPGGAPAQPRRWGRWPFKRPECGQPAARSDRQKFCTAPLASALCAARQARTSPRPSLGVHAPNTATKVLRDRGAGNHRAAHRRPCTKEGQNLLLLYSGRPGPLCFLCSN